MTGATTMPMALAEEAERQAVELLQQRVIRQMAEQRYRELYQEHFGKLPPPVSEAGAISMVHELGEGFRTAAAALTAAAERLRAAGDAIGARRAKEAAIAAHETADGLVRTDRA